MIEAIIEINRPPFIEIYFPVHTQDKTSCTTLSPHLKNPMSLYCR